AAIVVELSVDQASGSIELQKVFIAADVGQIVNPDGLSNQLEGGFIQAASLALYEQITLDPHEITSRDWESYPILRFDNAPEINTFLINRPGAPFLGAGEGTIGHTAAAIGNAIFNATGEWRRDVPFLRND
ncbi:MAG: molybdopterin cofactor-binding domain-containing protein, partial [Chloroflexota bacterium]